MVQLNPVPVFGAKKNTRSTISRKFFTENSLQMLSSYNLSIDTNQPPLVVHGRGILQNAKRPPKAERIWRLVIRVLKPSWVNQVSGQFAQCNDPE